jgi:uncharacterized membrane protein
MPAPVSTLSILVVLSAIVAGSEWICRYGLFRHVGSALLVIVAGAVASNAGLIPAGSPPDAPVAAYDAVFDVAAPIGLFYLLLSVNLREVLKAGVPLVLLFLAGAAGTTAGAIVAMRAVGEGAIGAQAGAIAGMFAGTYTGGSVNFNAIALTYGVMRDPVLYGGAVVVDNVITAVWIAATIAIPRILGRLWPRRAGNRRPSASVAPIVELAAENERVDPMRLGLVLALGGAAFLVSNAAANRLAAGGVPVPSILVLTTLALALAQMRAVSTLPGARVLGMYALYLFLTVIGAFCDVRALASLGRIGPALLGVAGLTVLAHAAVIFGAAWLFRIDLDGAAVASQANIGGSTSALALAKSLGREDLLVPGILLGLLGTAIGTFLGFLVARLV